MSLIKVGYIGSGLSFKVFHYPLTSSLPDLFVPTAIYVNSASSRTNIQADEKYSALKVYSQTEDDLRSMISSVDLVAISSPPGEHLFHLETCISLGKHCVIEKPICGNLETAKKIKEVADRAQAKGIIVTVFQNRRWDSNYLALKELIAKDTLGRIVTIKSRMDRWRPVVKTGHWRADPSQGGLVLDLGSHLADQIFALYGSPTRTTKFVNSQRQKGGSNDYFSIVMEYDAGPIITVEAGSLVSCPHHRFEVHGTKGSWTVDGEDPQEDQIKAGMSPLSPSFGVHPNNADLYALQEDGTIRHTSEPVMSGTWLDFYKDLAIAITTSSQPPVNIDDAISVLELLH